MKIIGIDLGTKCGISMLERTNGSTVCRTTAFNFDRKQYGMQFHAFSDELHNFLKAHRGSKACVFFEDVKAHSSTAAAHMYGYYRGALQRECFMQGIQCIGIGVGTIKKCMTGKGNASKEEVADGVNTWCESNKVPIGSFSANFRRPSQYLAVASLTNDQTDSIAIAVTGSQMIFGALPAKDSSDPTRKVIFQ